MPIVIDTVPTVLPSASATDLAIMTEAAADFSEQRCADGQTDYFWTQPGSSRHIDMTGLFTADLTSTGPGPARPDGTCLSTRAQAARLTGILWQAVFSCGGLDMPTARHFPAVCDTTWLTGLLLPAAGTLPSAQIVTRSVHSGEDTVHSPDVIWLALACQHLTHLAGHPVTGAARASAPGDETPVHEDVRVSAIVQVSGTEVWSIGEDPCDPSVTTNAGDILLLSPCAPHAIWTPAGPGPAVHLAFAVSTDAPASKAMHESA